MAINTTQIVVRPEELTLEEISARGKALYSKLRERIEATDWNRYIAIDVLTGDFMIAQSRGDAMRSIRSGHPDARLFMRKIGSDPEPDLAARILGTRPIGIPSDQRRQP